ncbi:MAG TPA: hypothetical protein VM011_08660 [Gammaproteobacteria bacterium]|nr:hypothetical protein [Gammaproteobacteria bacterium]
MNDSLMILSARDPKNIRLVRVPADFEAHEAYRHVTALIATVEENDPDYDWADIEALLEDNGFSSVDFILGPDLD